MGILVIFAGLFLALLVAWFGNRGISVMLFIITLIGASVFALSDMTTRLDIML